MRRATGLVSMVLILLVGPLTGCRAATAAVAGNLASMAVATFLMWSTLNLND